MGLSCVLVCARVTLSDERVLHTIVAEWRVARRHLFPCNARVHLLHMLIHCTCSSLYLALCMCILYVHVCAAKNVL